jgi:hypothetical protein
MWPEWSPRQTGALSLIARAPVLLLTIALFLTP